MSGVIIESAYYGDERSFANITKSLATKIAGNVLDVTASSDLKPTFEAAPQTKLDSRDQRQIRELAVKACGGESDQSCLERTRIKLSEERLKEKENEDLSKSVIKGDRLTMNIIDNGRRRTLVTPAGQKLKLENVVGNKTTGIADMVTVDSVQRSALEIFAIVMSTFFWVFSVVAVYTIFMRQYEQTGKDYFRMIAYGGAGVSLLIPGSGYVIILFAFAIPAFVREYIADKSKSQPLVR